jgi:Protein of unknown function (DUF3237)
LKTELLCRIEAEVGAIETLGAMAMGERRVVAITGGSVLPSTTHKLAGTILPGGADWQWVRNDGITEISAHYVMETFDGDRIEINSNGYRHGPAEVIKRLAAGEQVAASEYYFRTSVTFRTASNRPEIARLNGLLGIAVGERRARLVVLSVYGVL